MLKMKAGSYLCNLNCERPLIFQEKLGVNAGNGCLAVTNVYLVNPLLRMSEIALASPKAKYP
jgi:hypothetical protein